MKKENSEDKVTIALFCNGNFQGYRTLTKVFYERILAWSKQKTSYADVVMVVLSESKAKENQNELRNCERPKCCEESSTSSS